MSEENKKPTEEQEVVVIDSLKLQQELRNQVTLLVNLSDYYEMLCNEYILNGNASELNLEKEEVTVDLVYKTFNSYLTQIVDKLEELYLKYSKLDKNKTYSILARSEKHKIQLRQRRMLSILEEIKKLQEEKGKKHTENEMIDQLKGLKIAEEK